MKQGFHPPLTSSYEKLKIVLKSIIRAVSVLTVVVVAVLSYVQLSFVEQDYPLGAQHSGTILFGDSTLTKQQVLEGLREIGQTHDLDIYLGAPGAEDPFHGRDLYSLGKNQPEEARDIGWLTLGRHGKLYPASELKDTSLSAVYAVKGSDAGVRALQQWADENGATTSGWGDGGPLALFGAGLVYGAAGVQVVALAVLGVTVVLAWYAARAESRAVRLLAGTPRWRIQAQDMIGWLRVAFPVAVAGALAVGVGVGFARGWGNGLAVTGATVGYLAVLGVVAVVFGIVASLVTAPSAASLALRKPPEARFEFPSQLLKAVALALGLAALPAMVWQASSSLEQADIQGRVTPLSGYVSQAVGGVTNQSFESSIKELGRFAGAVDETGTLAYAEIVNRESLGASFTDEGFDSLAVINTHYARLFGLSQDEGTLAPVEEATAARLLRAIDEESQYGGITSSLRREASAEANGLRAYRITGDMGLVAPTGTGLGFRHAKRPLVLVSERISASLSDDALVSGLGSSYLMFQDPQVIAEKGRETGVSPLLLDRSRVTDSALLAAQFANQVVFTVGISIVILLTAIAISGWLSARVYAANNARFIFPMLTYGRSWWTVLRRRVLGEAIIVAVTFAVVSVVYLALGMALSPALMLGVAVYLGYSALCHQRAALAMIGRVTKRAH